MPQKEHGDLKKQSQFAAEDMTASALEQRDYVDIPAESAGENKVKRSQIDVLRPVAGTGESEKSVKAASG